MDTKFAGAPEINGYESINGFFYFSNAIIGWMRSIIYQFATVKIAVLASTAVKSWYRG